MPPPHVGMITGSGAQLQGTSGFGEVGVGNSIGAQRKGIPRGHCMGLLSRSPILARSRKFRYPMKCRSDGGSALRILQNSPYTLLQTFQSTNKQIKDGVVGKYM